MNRRYSLPTFLLCFGMGTLWCLPSEGVRGTATPAQEPVVIKSPKAGDAFLVGDVVSIQWEADKEIVDDVLIEISLDGRKSWIGLLDASIDVTNPAWGNYQWKIPAEIMEGETVHKMNGDAEIRVMGYLDPSHAISGKFEIQQPASISRRRSSVSLLKLGLSLNGLPDLLGRTFKP